MKTEEVMTITIETLSHPEASGDWHDKPLKYAVIGPASETQKFRTKFAAVRYRSLRARSASQAEAFRKFMAL